MPSVADKWANQGTNENQLMVDTMFPSKNRSQRLQMITEISHRARHLLTGLGVIRRRWTIKEIERQGGESFDVLDVWQEEFNINGVAVDRKGRLELEEAFVARRMPDKDEGGLGNT